MLAWSDSFYCVTSAIPLEVVVDIQSVKAELQLAQESNLRLSKHHSRMQQLLTTMPPQEPSYLDLEQ